MRMEKVFPPPLFPCVTIILIPGAKRECGNFYADVEAALAVLNQNIFPLRSARESFRCESQNFNLKRRKC